MVIDHTNCTHLRTPAGRRACRNGSRPQITKTPTQAMNDLVERQYQEIRMTGAVARRMARQAVKADNARIQPRRSGARVSINNSNCVQAALHTRGRCACGWENWEKVS